MACYVAMDTRGSWPYVADAADWIIVVSAAQLRRRRWQLCQQRVHSHKQARGVQTHSHLECAAQLAATHTLSNKYGKVFLHFCNVNLLFLVDGKYTVSIC